LADEAQRARFERLVLPHADAAYSLAFWLMRDAAQAEDAVQEAYLRAFRFFAAFRGENARPWLLGIVRNTCYDLLAAERRSGCSEEFDEFNHGAEAIAQGAVVSFPVNPEAAAIENAEHELLRRSLRALPVEFREALVLREFHECSYREIAAIAGVPLGTVMSRLSRGRRLLLRALSVPCKDEDTGT